MDPTLLNSWIKQTARAHGFAFTGIAKAEPLEDEARKLRQWLDAGYHGTMRYMENHFSLRTDPTQLVPGAKSVISLLYNYYNPDRQVDPDAPKLAMYAYGEDYHHVMRRKLKAILREIRSEFGEVSGRCFVDSGPVMEREWAKRSGVGWTGKNTLLINPKTGSYFFIAVIILDLEIAPDEPISDHCGTCTRCIDACPTDAIASDGYLLDARKCISYLTIENRAEIPDAFSEQMENWVFGCDICQDVCPWNRFARPHNEPAFLPTEELLQLSRSEWHGMTEERFTELFSSSAVKRTRYSGLRRNLDFLQK